MVVGGGMGSRWFVSGCEFVEGSVWGVLMGELDSWWGLGVFDFGFLFGGGFWRGVGLLRRVDG